MTDREKLLDGLNKIREFFEARADMAVGDGKLLLLNWANTARDALELLKEQEPRVLTLEEVMALPNGEETNAPVVREQKVPVETWDRGTVCQWCGARFVQETAEDNWYYGVEDYGKTWRVWTALPTKEQRNEVKWDAAD